MIYYKLFRPPTDPIHLPKGAIYTDYGETKQMKFGGFEVVGEIEIDRTLTTEECLHYSLEEKL